MGRLGARLYGARHKLVGVLAVILCRRESCLILCVSYFSSRICKIFFWSATYKMHAYAHIDNKWHSASFLNHASMERNSTESTCLEAAHCCTKTLQVPLHWDQLQLWLLISVMLDGKMPKKGPDVNKALPAFLMTTLSSWQWNQLVRNGKQTRTSRPAWHVGQFCACTNPTEMRPESRCRMLRETSIVFHRCYQ